MTEANDSIDTAFRLPPAYDSGHSYWLRTQIGAGDEDWFVFSAVDELVYSLVPSIMFIDASNPSSGTVTDRYEVCAYSSLASSRVACQLGEPDHLEGMPGCCALPSDAFPEGVADIQMDIDSVALEDTSEVYVRVRPRAWSATTPCTPYDLGTQGYANR